MYFERIRPSVYKFGGSYFQDPLPRTHHIGWTDWGWCSLKELHEIICGWFSPGVIKYDHYELVDRYGFEKDAVQGRFCHGLLVLCVNKLEGHLKEVRASDLEPLSFTPGLGEALRQKRVNAFVPSGWAKEVLPGEIHYRSKGIRVAEGRLVVYSDRGDHYYWGGQEVK